MQTTQHMLRASTRVAGHKDTERGVVMEVLAYSSEQLIPVLAQGWALRACRGVCRVHITEGLYRGLEGVSGSNNIRRLLTVRGAKVFPTSPTKGSFIFF